MRSAGIFGTERSFRLRLNRRHMYLWPRPMSARGFRFAISAMLTLLAATPDLPAQSTDRVGYTVAPTEADPGV